MPTLAQMKDAAPELFAALKRIAECDLTTVDRATNLRLLGAIANARDIIAKVEYP